MLQTKKKKFQLRAGDADATSALDVIHSRRARSASLFIVTLADGSRRRQEELVVSRRRSLSTKICYYMYDENVEQEGHFWLCLLARTHINFPKKVPYKYHGQKHYHHHDFQQVLLIATPFRDFWIGVI